MSVLSLSVSRGEMLYDIVVNRFLDAYIFEQTVLDICKDVTLQQEYMQYEMQKSDMSQIAVVAELFHNEMLDVFYQFGVMSDFSKEDIVYAQEKWSQNYYDSISGMVAQILFKNQKLWQQCMPAGWTDNISPYQNEIFPQFAEFATKSNKLGL